MTADDRSGAPTPPVAPEPAPLLLRAALRTWTRRDRAASGEVVLATAQDLIDQGGSVRREAAGLARGGAWLRIRGTHRDVAAAPWAAATRLAVIGCALLAASLVVSAGGGPYAIADTILVALGLAHREDAGTMGAVPPGVSPADAAIPMLVLLAVMVAGAAHARRMVVAAAASIVAVVEVAVMYTRGYGLGEAAFSYDIGRPAPDRYWIGSEGGPSAASTADYARGFVAAHVDLNAVVGLLLLVAALSAGAWAISHAPRRSDRAELDGASVAPRAGRRSWLALAVAALLAVVALPWLAEFPDGLLGGDAVVTLGWTGVRTAAAGAYVLVLALVLVGAGLLGLRRRAPAVSQAAAIGALALWIPALWIVLCLLQTIGQSPPLAGLLGEGAAVAAFWLVGSAVGLSLATGTVAAAGRAARRGTQAAVPVGSD